MASLRFLGRQRSTSVVFTITIGTNSTGGTYAVTIGQKTFSVPGDAGGNAATAADLYAVVAAAAEPEFQELTWAYTSGASFTGTAVTPGSNQAVSVAATGSGSPTMSIATTTANQSPADVDDVVNYSTGVLPVSTNDLYFDQAATSPAQFNLSALSAVALNSLNYLSAFEGDCGLPEINANSTAYEEYRPTYFQISATTVNIGDTTGLGSGSNRIKLNTGSVSAAINVYATGSGDDTGLPAAIWKGTGANNTLNMRSGSFGAAMFGGEVATLLLCNIAGGAVTLGPGCTLTTINMWTGTLSTASGFTTEVMYGGTHTHTAGNASNLTIKGGTFQPYAGVTITNLDVGSGATFDLSLCTGALTLINPTFRNGCTINDPNGVLPLNQAMYFPDGIGTVNFTRGGSTYVTLTNGQVEAAKAANYAISYTDNASRFTNAGATSAVNFTLPAINSGYLFEFEVVANQNFSITSNEGTNIVYDGTAAATALAFQTPGDKIGGHLFLYTNVAGTQWYVAKVCSNSVTQT